MITEVKIDVQCPSCKKKQKVVADLTQLKCVDQTLISRETCDEEEEGCGEYFYAEHQLDIKTTVIERVVK